VTHWGRKGRPRFIVSERLFPNAFFDERWEELRREPLLTQLKQRIRNIRQGPDGVLYVLTAEEKGALLRIEPDM